MDKETPGISGRRLVRLFTSRWIRECRAGMTHLPSAFRNSAVAKAWLRRAWAAPGIVIGLGLVAVYFLPPALDAGLNAILPRVTVEKKLLGVLPLQHEEANPHIPEIKSGLLLIAWIAIGAAGCVFAMRRLPEAAAAARDPAAQTDTRSVGLTTIVKSLDTNPGKSPAPPVATPGIGPDHRYAIGPELGRGGMGVVHLATDKVLDRPVAVKEFPRLLISDATLVRRFQQEAKSLARLTHPNIVQVYDLLEDSQRLWMVIELVEGGDVASLLVQKGRIDIVETASIGVQIAEGLGYAHSRGVVHRDVKPANILLTPQGTAKIADFGIAKLVGSGVTQTVAGEVFGSPSYMSPEQASGAAVDARSDIYSMGATLYEMLTGRPPFVADEAIAVLSQHLTKEVPSLREHVDDVPADLDELVQSMLAKEPEGRPQDMEETAQRLAAFR